MKRHLKVLCIAGWALVATQALAEVTVTEAWVRGTVATQKATGAFMKIRSSDDAKLVAAASPAATIVEVHEMAIKDNVMTMRAVDALPLPAGKTVELKPGGLHIMFIGLKAPLKKGDSFPLKLKFEKAGEVTVQVSVEAPGAAAHDMKH